MTGNGKIGRPAPSLEACVVVPAHLEAGSIASCIDALGGQQGIDAGAFEVLVVLSAGDRETEEPLLEACSRHPALAVHILRAEGEGPGPARRAGMDLASERLESLGRPDALIATTDADSVVAADWLVKQLEVGRGGARAIGGRIELGSEDLRSLEPRVVDWRRQRAAQRMAAVAADGRVPAEHWQFSGASIGITARTYRSIGGLEAVSALEDEALERALTRAGIPIHRLDSVKVRTSGRLSGRARRGLARDLELVNWLERNTFSSTEFSLENLLAAKAESVSLILPTSNVASTIERVLSEALSLVEAGLVDEVLVIDSDSTDGTVDLVRRAGVRIVAESAAMPDFGPARGKGDAMWRALAETTGRLVVFVDTDTLNFSADFILGMIGPLLTRADLDFVKGAYRRPLKIGDHSLVDEGGRVTELVARPLLNLHVPQLAGFLQPLAGETAARRDLLEDLPFPVGYGVEIAMLIDTLRLRGLGSMAQSDLGTRQNRHQPLRSLGAMAYAVLVAAGRRVHGEDSIQVAAPGPYLVPTQDGLDVSSVPVEERPPMSSVELTGERESG